MPVKKMFCSRLKTLRITHKVTLDGLGQALGVTRQAASRWETGERLPSIDYIEGIADYFGVSIDYLVGRTDKPEINR
ncbi:helix-turn-helix domain-containing protein [Anaerotruncus massiliensis (ex Liu et al. 2021)]|uniref:helix-turn-helix domain-containing protein n=1 Tax=Anaerotruncus massiliensis (ex Liu et al. 2021) TaxID=2321404 RepID=UPI003AF82A88